MKLSFGLLAGLCLAMSLPAQTVLVKPYVQSGNGTTLQGSDVKVITWMTDATTGNFTVEYGPSAKYGRTASVAQTALKLSPEQDYLKYSATLTDLPFNSEVHYRVKQGDKTVRETSVKTRKTADKEISFIVVGDTGDGGEDQKKLAFQMAKTKPESMLIVGDIVYSKGRVSEYLRKFWPVYNNGDKASATTGAGAFMQSVPIYGVVGNHDVGATNLVANPDGYGAFLFFSPPLNGPKGLDFFTPIGGTPELVANFKQMAGPAYPALCFYSFDNGPAHFVCLDACKYVLPQDPKLKEWIKQDLMASKAKWKFVFFHQPGFNSSLKHNDEQRMRLLAPLFEECGVDVVFAGHVHNYQRSKPLKFAPTEEKLSPRGVVPGTFKLDENYDGKEKTKPEGIVYIVTGGGGAKLYDTDFTGSPDKWKEPFTSKFISDRHSFSFVELTPEKFSLRQIDEEGKEVDEFVITK